MIEAFHRAVSTGNQNTYKFALGRVILEEYRGDACISLIAIARKFADYYYKNHIVFKLRETNNPVQEPTATLILRKLIKEKYGDHPPPNRLTKKFRVVFAGKLLNPPPKLGRSAFTYVLPCWQGATRNVRGYYDYPPEGSNDFFSYSRDEGYIDLKASFIKTIEKHRSILLSLVILEWGRFLEKFNQTPNLISKLSGKKPTRRLSKFRTIFLQTPTMRAKTCHLCGSLISEKDLTLDHIIPFDYVYSDELWNLVPAHRACNSKKGASVGSVQMVNRLIARNRLLWELHDTPAQKWIRSSGESVKALENKIRSHADSAIKSGFKRVRDSDFNDQ